MTCATYAADSENAERYVLGQMEEAEQASFEEHFFGCDACFASVQTLQQMQTALRTRGGGRRRTTAAPVAPAAAATAARRRRRRGARDGRAFPKRGIAGVDAKWWGLAVAATLLLTAVWWPRRGVEPGRAGTTVARNTEPAAQPPSSPSTFAGITRRPVPNRPASNPLTDSRARRFPAAAERAGRWRTGEAAVFVAIAPSTRRSASRCGRREGSKRSPSSRLRRMCRCRRAARRTTRRSRSRPR